MDEIEEVETFNGLIAFCNYCGASVDSLKKLIHIRDEKHREMTSTGIQSFEDKILRLKGDLLSQSEEEFIATKDLVLACERTLKIVSDEFLKKSEEEIGMKKEAKCDSGEEDSDDSSCDESDGENKLQAPQKRVFKGVMRTGSLANGLLMRGERQVTLVVLCEGKPTYKLLKDLQECFVNTLPHVSPSNKLKVEFEEGDSSFTVVLLDDRLRMECRIAITSPKCRTHPFKLFNEKLLEDPKEMLPRTQCEEMLRIMRRARWFESKCYSHRYSEVTLKILRDICKRDTALKFIDDWLLQCLFYKVISSSADSSTVNLGGLFQRFFECISSGILLPDGPELQDPCEREPNDLREGLSMQQTLSVTTAAQKMLRMIAMKQLAAIICLTKKEIDAGLQSLPVASKRKNMDVDENFEDKRKRKS